MIVTGSAGVAQRDLRSARQLGYGSLPEDAFEIHRSSPPRSRLALCGSGHRADRRAIHTACSRCASRPISGSTMLLGGSTNWGNITFTTLGGSDGIWRHQWPRQQASSPLSPSVAGHQPQVPTSAPDSPGRSVSFRSRVRHDERRSKVPPPAPRRQGTEPANPQREKPRQNNSTATP
jgi:hypothetical protein